MSDIPVHGNLSTLPPIVTPGSSATVGRGVIWRRVQACRERWRFAEHVATLGAGTGVAQAVSIAAAPIITRLYTPSQLGILGLFTSFLGVAAVATSLKYELAIISARDDSEAAQITWASVVLCLPTAVVGAALLLAAIHFNWFGFGELPPYATWLFLPTLALTGIYTALRYWTIREERFGTVSKTFVAQHASRSAMQVGLGVLRIGTGGLLAGETAGRAVSAGALLRTEWRRIQRLHAASSNSVLLASLRRFWELPIYSLPSSLIDNLASNVTIPLLIALFGATAGGEFALVSKVTAVPLALIAASVADAFHRSLAVCYRETPREMMKLFLRTGAGLLAVGLVPTIILIFAGRFLFGLVFGSEWAAAGVLAAISAPCFLAQFIVSPLSRLVFVLRGQQSKLIYDIVLLASMWEAFRLARLHHLSLLQTVWAFTIMNTAAYVVYFFVLVHIIKSSTREHRAV